MQNNEESSERETTSFSYLFEIAFSLFLGELGQGDRRDIVLTRLSLKTNWLVDSALQKGKQGFRSSSPSSSKVSVSWRVLLERQPPTDRRPRGRRWGGGAGTFWWNKYFWVRRRRKTILSFSVSSSFSSSILGEAGERVFQKVGVYLREREN